MSSPTQRTLAKLRADGYRAEVVEKWNPHAKRRNDLFGVVDVLGIRRDQTIAVQCTSASNVSARLNKLENSDALPDMREAGWTVVVHGWRKRKGRWECREVDIS